MIERIGESMKNKIVIIGAGHVGSHCAMSIAMQGISDEIVFIDIDEQKAIAHAKDISDATSLMPKACFVHAGSYEECDDASIVVISIGVSRKPGQTRLDMLDDTILMMQDVMPKLCATKFDGILLTISNPADIVAYYAANHCVYDRNKVFGTGTSLDTLRLKRTLSEVSGVSQSDISCYSMGEHGNSSMIPFTQVKIDGKAFQEFGFDEQFILDRTRAIGNEIVDGKGSTEFGIGMACAKICKAILQDEKVELLLSAFLQGEYGYENIYIGVPCIVGRNGIEKIVELALSESEKEEFEQSVAVIKQYINRI